MTINSQNMEAISAHLRRSVELTGKMRRQELTTAAATASVAVAVCLVGLSIMQKLEDMHPTMETPNVN